MSIFTRTKKGFTLIELLVVIAIIGILSSVVLASLNDARLKSRDAKRIADLKQVQLALELYFDSKGGYPTTLGELTPLYMATLPKDPTPANSYAYAALGTGATCSSYHLGARLEQSTNNILNTDIDADAGTVCTDGGTDFQGNAYTATTCTGTTAVSPDQCYDLKP
jgi:prepilin-type N-terminal cleavage/methylation domain-containing protein